MADGWIKLHRQIQDSQMYKNLNSKQRDVLFQCLLLANHTENKWEWGGKIHMCKPGQFISSLDGLQSKCAKDVKVQSVRTALLKLEEWHFLTNESTKTGRLITILNWDVYQNQENDTNKQSNRQPTKLQQSSNKALTTNKNVKNDKNVKNNRVFAKPSIPEIREYSISINFPELDCQKFFDFYESKGWMVGKNKMKDWKAAIRTWKPSAPKPTKKADIPRCSSCKMPISDAYRKGGVCVVCVQKAKIAKEAV